MMLDSTEWAPPPTHVVLPRAAVHVWRVRLNQPASRLRELAELLDPDEQERERRFRFKRDSDRFVARRGLLRTILSRYLTIPPRRIRFHRPVNQKPRLVRDQVDIDLRFSTSHSDDLGLIAIGLEREVGVDIERIRPELADERAAERYFSARELADLRSVPEEDQTVAFFNCWSRKEAYVKAKGLGLAIPLDSFDVSLIPGQPATLLATRPDTADAQRWSMRALSPDPEYVAALVVENRGWRLQCWDPGFPR